jgi:hypothetical protein
LKKNNVRVGFGLHPFRIELDLRSLYFYFKLIRGYLVGLRARPEGLVMPLTIQ